jgi:hypothetical protein
MRWCWLNWLWYLYIEDLECRVEGYRYCHSGHMLLDQVAVEDNIPQAPEDQAWCGGWDVGFLERASLYQPSAEVHYGGDGEH